MLDHTTEDSQVLDPQEDVADREERLTSLLQVLGFPSLDHLEDFIVLHGSAKLVPTSALSAHGQQSLSLDETQATSFGAGTGGGTHYDETAHARRHQQRKVQNAELKRENEQVRNEVEWARKERQADKDALEELGRDKKRLLDRVEALMRANEQLRFSSSSSAVPGGAVGSSLSTRTGTDSGNAASTQAQLQACYDDIANLEAANAALEEDLERTTTALEAAEEKIDELAGSLKGAEEQVWALRKETDKKEEELTALKRKIRRMMGSLLGEEEEEDAMMEDDQQQRQIRSSATVALEPFSPMSVVVSILFSLLYFSHPALYRLAPSPSLSRASASRSPALPSQLRGPPAPSPFQPSPRTNRPLRSSSTASPAPLSPAPVMSDKSTVKNAAGGNAAPSGVEGGPACEGAGSGIPPPLPFTATAKAPPATAEPIAPPRPTAIPTYLLQRVPSSSPTSTSGVARSPRPRPSTAARPTCTSTSASTSAAPSPTGSLAGLSPSQQEQLRLLPRLLHQYAARRTSYTSPSLRSRLADAKQLLDMLASSEGERGVKFGQKVEATYGAFPVLLPLGDETDTVYPLDPGRPFGLSSSLSLSQLKQSIQSLAVSPAGPERLADLYDRTSKLEAEVEKKVSAAVVWVECVVQACQGEMERREKRSARRRVAAVAAAEKGVKGEKAAIPAKRVAEVVAEEGKAVTLSSPTEATAMGDPVGGKGQPVKKRRKVVRPSSAFASSAAAGATPSSTSVTPAPADPAQAAQTANNAILAAAASTTPRPGPSTLPPAVGAAITSASIGPPPSSKGKKRWNLVSPTKKNAATPLRVGSPVKSPKTKLNLNINEPSPTKMTTTRRPASPTKTLTRSSPVRGRGGSEVLVEETQLPLPRSPPPPAPVFAPVAASPAPLVPAETPRRSDSHTSHTSSRSSHSHSHTPFPSTYEPEPDTLVSVVPDGEVQRQRSSSLTVRAGRAGGARSSSRSPLKTVTRAPPRRTPSVASRAGKNPGPVQVAVAEDDPFTARPAAAVTADKATFTLQPSPNSRTHSNVRSTSPSKKRTAHLPGGSPFHPPRSPSASPSPSRSLAQPVSRNASFVAFECEMPPSAQPQSEKRAKGAGSGLSGRRERAGESDREEAGGDGEEQAFRAELRLFGGLGSPPVLSLPRQPAGVKGKGKAKGKKRAPEAEEPEEEEELERVKDEPESLVAAAAVVAAACPSTTSPPSKSRKKPRRSRTQEEEQASLEGLDMPPFPLEEKARKLWLKELKKRRKDRDERLEKEGRGRAKGKGRKSGGGGGKGSTATADASTSTSTSRAIELNPDRNRGEKHHYKEVVRSKAERAKMMAEECAECASYYARADRPAPRACGCNTSRPRGGGTMRTFLDDRAEENERRLQDVGRHRVQQRTEPDPPDYWQLGMPSSGGVEEINEEARRLKAEKRAYQEREAERGNGYYRYVQEEDA
ncbi:hypothetical protein JCM11251_006005 [Rhodosporidiobolus azoricus]